MLGCQVKNLSLAGQPPPPLMHHVFAASPAGAYGAAFPAQRPSVRTLIVHNSAAGSAGFRVRPAPGGAASVAAAPSRRRALLPTPARRSPISR